MIQTTTWRPNTCKCVISYTWDDAVPPALRVHTYSSWALGPGETISPTVSNATTHPAVVIGAQVEGSAFVADHLTKSLAIQSASL